MFVLVARVLLVLAMVLFQSLPSQGFAIFVPTLTVWSVARTMYVLNARTVRSLLVLRVNCV